MSRPKYSWPTYSYPTFSWPGIWDGIRKAASRIVGSWLMRGGLR